jgi:hypothetical protein
VQVDVTKVATAQSAVLRTIPVRTVCLIGWWGVAAAIAVALSLPPAHAGDSLGIRRFLSPEVTTATRVGQRFRMNSRNLDAIEIRVVKVGPVDGAYQLTLADGRTGEVVRRAEVAAVDVARGESYRFEFEPVAFSEERLFDFEIAAAPENPGRGVAVWATKGERLTEGGLLINGTTRWASLAFEASTPAARPVVALFRAPQAARPPRWLALVGLIAAWIVLRPVLRALAEFSSGGILAR